MRHCRWKSRGAMWSETRWGNAPPLAHGVDFFDDPARLEAAFLQTIHGHELNGAEMLRRHGDARGRRKARNESCRQLHTRKSEELKPTYVATTKQSVSPPPVRIIGKTYHACESAGAIPTRNASNNPQFNVGAEDGAPF